MVVLCFRIFLFLNSQFECFLHIFIRIITMTPPPPLHKHLRSLEAEAVFGFFGGGDGLRLDAVATNEMLCVQQDIRYQVILCANFWDV